MKTLDEGKRSKMYATKALASISSDTWRLIKRTLKRFILYWTGTTKKDMFSKQEVGISEKIVGASYLYVLLLGMGGSSLASEVISLSFRGYAEGLELSILDSTHPQQVKFSDLKNPKGKTIYIVSSKSGGTTEVQAFLHYFYKEMENVLILII